MKRKLNITHGILGAAILLVYLVYGQYLLNNIEYPWSSVITGLVIVSIAYLIIFSVKADVKEAVPIKPVRLTELLYSLGMMAGVFFISASVNTVTDILFTNAGNREAAIAERISASPLGVSIIVIALIPAISEEIFFRGFFLGSARSLNNDTAALIISALLFGAMHMDLYSFIPTALFGALFAFIAIKTGSVVIPMILHFINNVCSVIISYASASSASEIADEYTVSTGERIIYIVIYLIIGVILTALFGYLMTKKEKNKNTV